MTRTVILGAGISGLYTGFRLAEKGGQRVTLVEKTSTVGGMAKALPYKCYWLDFGPHKIYSVLPGILDEYQRIMNNRLITVTKHNSIFLEGKRITFPISPLKAPFQINPISIMKCGFSFITAKIKQAIAPRPIKTYEDYFLAGFGQASYKLLFRDLALKVWGDPKTLTEELARKRVPVPNLLELITGIFRRKPTMSAKTFLYPPGGFREVAETLKRKIEGFDGSVSLDSQPTGITIKDGKVNEIRYETEGKKHTVKNPDFVVSTIHVLDLLNLITPRPPEAVIAAANRLRWRGLVLVFLFFDRPNVLGENWTFFPERRYIFNRLSEPTSQSPEVAPKGKTYVIAEVTLDPTDPLFEDDAAVTKRVIEDLAKAGICRPNDIKETLVKKARRIYPVYDVDYRENLVKVLKWLDCIQNMFSIGRPGLFNYNNTDHCIDTGMKLADTILAGGKMKDWIEVRKSFNAYSIID
ncbi:FAD-dependent oxidoreductase [Candidatus Woesearchaeota archaeon]|nr:FAD-dependent oxidoreductase [Candidatus Woesearchaeota archaeon]